MPKTPYPTPEEVAAEEVILDAFSVPVPNEHFAFYQTLRQGAALSKKYMVGLQMPIPVNLLENTLFLQRKGWSDYVPRRVTKETSGECTSIDYSQGSATVRINGHSITVSLLSIQTDLDIALEQHQTGIAARTAQIEKRVS